jgi:predicted ATP-grasp superfamily ATP-dependent carboligase
MKLLVFEFATATGLNDPSFKAEGRAMLCGLLEDLKDFKTYHLISDDTENISDYSIPLTVHAELDKWLESNIQRFDACIPIAPEENNILHDLTLIIENKGVKVLGSSSDAVKLTTNKYETYKFLKGKYPIIKTDRVYFKANNQETNEYERHNGPLFKDNGSKVLKPADGVSCSGVMVVKTMNDFICAHDRIQMITRLPYFIVQDYKPGITVSVSLLCNGDSAVPLSLNLQDVKLDAGEIKYHGGNVPFEHNLSKLAMEIAKNAVESIGGLKGYVGVDMILDEDNNEIHIVEINSRLTTAYVALRKIINLNLGEAILKSVQGELPTNIILNGEINFIKEGDTLRISVL